MIWYDVQLAVDGLYLFLEESGETLKSDLVDFSDDVEETDDADDQLSETAHLARTTVWHAPAVHDSTSIASK